MSSPESVVIQAGPSKRDSLVRSSISHSEKASKIDQGDSWQIMCTLTHESLVRVVVAFPDGKKVLTASMTEAGPCIAVWGVVSEQELLRFQGVRHVVYAAAVFPDGRRALTGGSDRMATVWDAEAGSPLLQLKGHSGSVEGVAVFANGQKAVTCSMDWSTRIWDAVAGIQLLKFEGHGDAVSAVVAFPLSDKVLSGSDDRTARIWDVETGTQYLHLVGHQGAVHSVAIFPDGSKVVTGSEDNTAIVWAADTGAQLYTLQGHRQSVKSLSVLHELPVVLTGCLDGVARVWELTTRSQHQLPGHGQVLCMAPLSQGNRVAVAGDKGVTIWERPVGLPLILTATLEGACIAVECANAGGAILAQLELNRNGKLFEVDLLVQRQAPPPLGTHWQLVLPDFTRLGEAQHQTPLVELFQLHEPRRSVRRSILQGIRSIPSLIRGDSQAALGS